MCFIWGGGGRRFSFICFLFVAMVSISLSLTCPLISGLETVVTHHLTACVLVLTTLTTTTTTIIITTTSTTVPHPDTVRGWWLLWSVCCRQWGSGDTSPDHWSSGTDHVDTPGTPGCCSCRSLLDTPLGTKNNRCKLHA